MHDMLSRLQTNATIAVTIPEILQLHHMLVMFNRLQKNRSTSVEILRMSQQQQPWYVQQATDKSNAVTTLLLFTLQWHCSHDILNRPQIIINCSNYTLSLQQQHSHGMFNRPQIYQLQQLHSNITAATQP